MKRAQGPAHILLLAACAWLPACGLNQGGVDPPSDRIAFPASAVMDRTGQWLLVTNSNADLRYNDGSLMAFSLRRAANDRGIPREQCRTVSDVNPLSDPVDFCCRDALDPNITNCDERSYIGDDDHKGYGLGNVRIGSFAAGMVLQQPSCPLTANPTYDPNNPDPNEPQFIPCDACDGYHSGDDRLLLGVRGDTSLTYVDINSTDVTADTPKPPPPSLKCVGDPTNPDTSVDFATCDDKHHVITAMSGLASPSMDPNPPPIPLPDEPYALAIDGFDGLLFIGHLSGNSARAYTGGFSLFDIAPPGQTGHLDTPRFIAPFSSPFSPNAVGSVGVTALTNINDIIYASSRYQPQTAGLGTTAQCPGGIREIAAFPNGTYYNPPLLGSETRGIRIVNGRAFVLQRSPPALVGFASQSTTPTDVLETCGSPTFLDQHNNGVGDRLFVTCFADGEIYVYDPAIPRLVKTFVVGRGPSGLVFDDTPIDPNDPQSPKRNVAYVVGFGDNNISVIDLDPTHTTEYHVVQRIGFPRVIPR